MNNALQNALTQLLHQISSAGHVVASQLPDVLRQLIAYNIVECWAWIVFFAIADAVVVIAIALWIKHAIYEYKDGCWDGEDTALFSFLFSLPSLGGLAGFSVGLIVNILTLIELEFMPKAWLLDYIRGAIGH